MKVFREEAVSGTMEMAARPRLSELLQALSANGTNLVLVEKLDRLARDLMIQESIIASIQKSGNSIVSVAEPDLCNGDPSRKLMRQMMGAFFEYEKTMIVAKLRGARERVKAKTGRCEGIKPFGYYEDEQATLQRMRELRAEGLGFDRLAEKLNAEGYTSRLGRRWHGLVVNRILSRVPKVA